MSVITPYSPISPAPYISRSVLFAGFFTLCAHFTLPTSRYCTRYPSLQISKLTIYKGTILVFFSPIDRSCFAAAHPHSRSILFISISPTPDYFSVIYNTPYLIIRYRVDFGYAPGACCMHMHMHLKSRFYGLHIDICTGHYSVCYCQPLLRTCLLVVLGLVLVSHEKELRR